MARRRRQRTVWISDAVGVTNLASNAAGALFSTGLISEGTIEDFPAGGGGRGTLLRVVGDIYLCDDPDATGTSFLAGIVLGVFDTVAFNAFSGSSLVIGTAWENSIDRHEVIYTKQWAAFGGSAGQAQMRVPIDVRSKRRLSRGETMALFIENQELAAAGVADLQFSYHLRCLVGL